MAITKDLFLGWEVRDATNEDIVELLNSMVGSAIKIEDRETGTITRVVGFDAVRPDFLIVHVEYELPDGAEDLMQRLFAIGENQGISIGQKERELE